MRIVRDHREKRPWTFDGVEVVEGHLETGDYTVEGFEDSFAVERKSVNDLATSVGAERDRFEAEVKRGQELTHFVVIVEGTEAEIEAEDYYSNIHPNAVLGTTEKWPLRYDTLEFIFAGGRATAAQECLRRLDKWYVTAASDLF